MARRLLFRVLAGMWMLLGVWAMAVGGSMRAKAEVAQWLISTSWQRGIESSQPMRPWPWSDSRVAARLEVPELHQDLYVMDNDSGEGLAFGPGFSSPGAGSGAAAITVVSGHRDTHFAFLGDVLPGAEIGLTRITGERQVFAAWRATVVDSRRGRWPPGVAAGDLLLVTCYPLDAVIPGGALRLVLIAKPVTNLATSSSHGIDM